MRQTCCVKVSICEIYHTRSVTVRSWKTNRMRHTFMKDMMVHCWKISLISIWSAFSTVFEYQGANTAKMSIRIQCCSVTKYLYLLRSVQIWFLAYCGHMVVQCVASLENIPTIFATKCDPQMNLYVLLQITLHACNFLAFFAFPTNCAFSAFNFRY